MVWYKGNDSLFDWFAVLLVCWFTVRLVYQSRFLKKQINSSLPERFPLSALPSIHIVISISWSMTLENCRYGKGMTETDAPTILYILEKRKEYVCDVAKMKTGIKIKGQQSKEEFLRFSISIIKECFTKINF